MRGLWAVWGALVFVAAVSGGCAAVAGGAGAADSGCTAHTAACEPDGYFSTVDGKCANPCIEEGACIEVGAAGCQPGTAEDCEHSWACLGGGACALGSYDGTPKCVVTDDAHCLASDGCANSGDCHVATSYTLDGALHSVPPTCMPTSAADCQQSADCAQWGFCTLHGNSCTCPDPSRGDCK